MRWFSGSGEFAFVSFGGVARGIIAVGGTAHGVVAVGGIASVGVISIGMNAAGSVVAFGMNAVAPISFSLINGLGIYSRAGVNAWGTWSHAGTNATGAFSRGGVNSNHSWLPAVIVILLLLGLSSVLRGKRERRGPSVLRLRRFLSTPAMAEAKVRARLRAVHPDAIDLADAGHEVSAVADGPTVREATSIRRSSSGRAPAVLVELRRTEERVLDERPRQEASYRQRPEEVTRTILRCTAIEAPPRKAWWPQDAGEVQWVLAWTARLAAVIAAGVIWFVALR